MEAGRPVVDRPDLRRRARPTRWVAAVIAAVVLLTASVATTDWYLGGNRLGLDSAGLGVHAVPVGRPVSFGVGMRTSADSPVTVEKATARHSANISVQFTIVRTGPGQLGIGTADGVIAGSPVHGARVAQLQGHPERGATWLVVTVVAHGPGPWTVTRIAVTYRSRWRTLTTVSGYDVQGMASTA